MIEIQARDTRALIQAAVKAPKAKDAQVFALCAIASALDDIARGQDHDGIADGVKDLAVQVGGLAVALGDR